MRIWSNHLALLTFSLIAGSVAYPTTTTTNDANAQLIPRDAGNCVKLHAPISEGDHKTKSQITYTGYPIASTFEKEFPAFLKEQEHEASEITPSNHEFELPDRPTSNSGSVTWISRAGQTEEAQEKTRQKEVKWLKEALVRDKFKFLLWIQDPEGQSSGGVWKKFQYRKTMMGSKWVRVDDAL